MKLKFLWVSLLFFVVNVAIAAQPPVVMLKQTASQVILSLQKNKVKLKHNPDIANQIVRRILIPRIDQMQMARSVLPRGVWTQATSQQRKAFLKEFKTLVVRTYAAAFSEYTNETVKFYPVRSSLMRQDSIQVKSEIVRPGRPSIPVSYNLTKRRSGWKIYDFSVDGISMVRSFRSQFAGLSRQGMPALIKQLKKHNTRTRT